MLQNAYFLAKIGADTAENEQHFAKICQKLATTLRVERSLVRALERAKLSRRYAMTRQSPRGTLRWTFEWTTDDKKLLART